mgnify:CR=1 FL=1
MLKPFLQDLVETARTLLQVLTPHPGGPLMSLCLVGPNCKPFIQDLAETWRTILGTNQCCRTEIEPGQLISTIELCVGCRISERANEESDSMHVRAYSTAEKAILRGGLKEPVLGLVGRVAVIKDLTGFGFFCGGPYWERTSVVEPRSS